MKYKREKTLYTFELIGLLATAVALAFMFGIIAGAGIHFYFWLIK